MRHLAKGTVLLIWSGLSFLFFTAQVGIFQISSEFDNGKVIFSPGERTPAKRFRKMHAFVEGKGCKSFSLSVFTHII